MYDNTIIKSDEKIVVNLKTSVVLETLKQMIEMLSEKRKQVEDKNIVTITAHRQKRNLMIKVRLA